MRGQPSVWIRTRRLAAVHRSVDLLEEATRLAVDLGISPEDLLAEAAALQRRAQAVGATSNDAVLAFVAAEGGIPEAEVRAVMARVGAAP